MSLPDSTPLPEPTPGLDRCGHPRQGQHCKRPPGDRTEHKGWVHCWIHGGNSPSGRKWAATLKAKHLVAERRRELMFYRIEMPEVTPEEVLLEEVQRSSAIVRWLEEMIDQWRVEPLDTDAELRALIESEGPEAAGDSQLDAAATSRQTGLPRLGTVVYFDKGGTVAPTEVAAWIKIYQDERMMAVKAAKTAIDAGIAERLVRIAEREVDVMVAVLRASLEELGLPVTPEVGVVVARQLRAIGGASGLRFGGGAVE